MNGPILENDLHMALSKGERLLHQSFFFRSTLREVSTVNMGSSLDQTESLWAIMGSFALASFEELWWAPCFLLLLRPRLAAMHLVLGPGLVQSFSQQCWKKQSRKRIAAPA